MSLSSLLLSSRSQDSELDALFSNVPTQAQAQAGPSTITQKKRKIETTESAPENKKLRVERPKDKAKKAQKQEKVIAKKNAVPDDQDEDDDNVEETYQRAKDAPAEESATVQSEAESVSGDSEGEGDPTTLVHESLSSKSKAPKKKTKFVPEDETPEQRNQRTIFIGNLPVDVAQKKSNLKQLKRHVLAFVPDAKIESVRFRSIAFQTPTSQLPDDADDDKSKSKGSATKDKRTHDRERASKWKDDETKGDEKKFLTPSQKKKIAFINQDFHSSASSVNAYMVFAHIPDNPDSSPYATAQLVAEKCNGTTLMERVIRVDVVGTPDAVGDPKLSVFVGNLDFASKDEDLRIFFEGAMSAERGPPPEGSVWVTRVRIVRDRETQLGKGFAYIQFSDKQCVDEIVALEEGKLRFAKRKLRVQRCKTSTGRAAPPTRKAPAGPSTSTPKQPVTVRAGDPSLGDRLAHLSKDARKKVKSSDADRIARRLEKKKARNLLSKEVKVRDRVRKKPSGPGKHVPSKPARRVRSEQSLSKRNMKK